MVGYGEEGAFARTDEEDPVGELAIDEPAAGITWGGGCKLCCRAMAAATTAAEARLMGDALRFDLRSSDCLREAEGLGEWTPVFSTEGGRCVGDAPLFDRRSTECLRDVIGLGEETVGFSGEGGRGCGFCNLVGERLPERFVGERLPDRLTGERLR